MENLYDNLLFNKYLLTMQEVWETIKETEEFLKKIRNERKMKDYFISDSPEWNNLLEYHQRNPPTKDELELISFSEFCARYQNKI